uniref:Uncharacterized protein n=1 Tax=Hyaloperonospora arabidopsidis (strain Emoy2) TaxID=559515 RepID=M4BRK6_HYAAE
MTGVGPHNHSLPLTCPPRDAAPRTYMERLAACLKGGLVQLCLIVRSLALSNHESPDEMEPKSAREERCAAQSWEERAASKNSVLVLAREFSDVFPNTIPAVLSVDMGVRHDIDLSPDPSTV